jgi:hypothetical protein
MSLPPAVRAGKFSSPILLPVTTTAAAAAAAGPSVCRDVRNWYSEAAAHAVAWGSMNSRTALLRANNTATAAAPLEARPPPQVRRSATRDRMPTSTFALQDTTRSSALHFWVIYAVASAVIAAAAFAVAVPVARFAAAAPRSSYPDSHCDARRAPVDSAHQSEAAGCSSQSPDVVPPTMHQICAPPSAAHAVNSAVSEPEARQPPSAAAATSVFEMRAGGGAVVAPDCDDHSTASAVAAADASGVAGFKFLMAISGGRTGAARAVGT